MDKITAFATYGAEYIDPKSNRILKSLESDSYHFELYSGSHHIKNEPGDSVIYLGTDLASAHWVRGPSEVDSKIFGVKIRGYSPDNRSVSFSESTILPYLNGCSTKQLFPPARPGDPTFQMLKIPPFSTEQRHHIHSTVRCVFVLSGEGESVVGMGSQIVREKLFPGKIVVLQKMCPHHFETSQHHLTVLPVHIWSSIESAEFDHPMMNGTFTS